MHTFALPATAWITISALVCYIWVMSNAGRARTKYAVQAPSMEGPPEFMAAQRVQANMVEQMVIFLPALWLCALTMNDRAAALGGAIWVIGRVLYALGYYRDPSKRGPGFMISSFASVGLILASVAGLIMH